MRVITKLEPIAQPIPRWKYVGVYADEALTGTKDARPEFQRLIKDCRNGKIDMVITKSIARFARNTVTMLEIVRELKLLGIDVYFEKENIHSLSGDGELMLTILASYAQEESRSVSENCKWRIRKRFAQGELVSLRFMFGYRIEKGEVEVDPETADIVRMIFEDYIDGMGGSLIAKKLREMGVPALRGGTWNAERVVAIIKNEKYTGNALLQKKYVSDHLTKKEVWNKGRLPQYYSEDTHPAIIDMETFEMAQEIMERRRNRFGNKKDVTPNKYPFSGKIVCESCGKNYKRKVTAGKPYWQCSTFLQDGKDYCHAKQIPEDILHTVTAAALGLAVFETEAFTDRIAEIRVPEANKLVFVFHDGRFVERVWHDRSRADSWTDEMKQAARDRMTPELREASRQRMHEINRKRRKRV
ncbi:DNA invertase Pin-like site-specific DNA recombinase [Ruminiclostridium sufflavum DSM 19573]|uniref:DNA invertase Pin-like site-specific DNA recombinase n=1 Tax=Ruminiclostridium sufflavum DSM 19573 TaxID=1121337 RepID=A0A318XJX2_9FIRM|nr:recombinase family protein [Ruminiclostridium sufflavum]PYG85717.1 DNA invertase Pin-like site-specific DNA recombinase [Ruminiclostridium sufflavum DSM 19573]